MYDCQQLRHLLIRGTLLIAVCTSAIIYFYRPFVSDIGPNGSMYEPDTKPNVQSTYIGPNGSMYEPDTKPNVQNIGSNGSMYEPDTKPDVQIKQYDVLLSSYMRSGSSLTGKILDKRTDTFYVYEPLWKVSRWTYWHGNNTICRADRLDCRAVEPEKAVQDKSFPENQDNVPPVSLVKAKRILRNIYDCQFDSRSTVQKRKCKNAIHRVTKVLRLSTDLLADMLHARDNLKVIHLIRDPRAIINSRIHAQWFEIRTEDEIIENGKHLCNKMLYDIREGQKLFKLYTDRFKFIYYEDLTEKPFDKSKELFKYFGMDLAENKYPELKNLPVFRNDPKATERVKNTAFWWRMTLKWNIVQKMESACKDVFAELGYKSFANVEECRNMSISSVNIPKEYLIL